ncbi:MAG: sugar phosphate isomerase/epimerase [Oscillospiraceae bacterium]|nr:sugar phosphate isomerase/epimerase [Oscillospiraceae bacterium]
MKFGVFSVSMPEYGLEESVKLLAELGYDGVEWRVAEMPAEEPKDVPFAYRYWAYNKSTIPLTQLAEKAAEVKALCSRYGVEIFGLTSYLPPSQHEQIELLLKAAQAMSCGMVRVFPPQYNEADDYNKAFAEMRRDAETLEKLAGRYGVKIVFEIHMDNLLASPSAARRMLEGLDPNCLGVIFDPGNMVNEGFENYKKSLDMLGAYVAHVHIKNGILERDGEDELGAAKWKRVWTPLKAGMADLGKFFKVLRASGYDGTVCIEDFSNEESTYDKLKGNLAYLKQLYDAAAPAAE